MVVPSELLPADGRFGCGPSKVRRNRSTPSSPRRPRSSGRPTARNWKRRLVGEIRRGSPSCSAFRTMGGHPRQRRHDGNLGRRHVWACRAPQPTPRVRRVLRQVRRRLRKAAPHLASPSVISAPPGDHPEPHPEADVDVYADPQRDVHRRGDEAAPSRRCRRRPARPRRRHVGGRRPAVGTRRCRRVLLRPAEVLPPTAASGSPPVRPPRSNGSIVRRLGALAPGVARSRHRPRQQPSRPDANTPP